MTQGSQALSAPWSSLSCLLLSVPFVGFTRFIHLKGLLTTITDLARPGPMYAIAWAQTWLSFYWMTRLFSQARHGGEYLILNVQCPSHRVHPGPPRCHRGSKIQRASRISLGTGASHHISLIGGVFGIVAQALTAYYSLGTHSVLSQNYFL
ncbi:hypothetical protein ARMSODRAFT_947292 [Armillaria solidipes]|uniref:Uncharacterized protein n=1 Tax=Armillaria solidipes TaxID=1076256 RepID=A0A2H3CJ21_9AGAR|nr:hypothetical protein ARMSODRAFT_947292 [Armillaria solidipes]